MDGEVVSDFPAELTIDGLETLWDNGVISDYETFEDLRDAQTFMKAFERGLSSRVIALYTQVDGGENDEVYLKGVHVVNRTGIYLVAWGG